MAGWTKEQQEAIDARGCNLLVAAAAGSGKTAVLVERILQLIIKDKVDIERLLVVTFTNAAAGEMRERIGAALTRALDEASPADSDHLRRQMNALPRASISTIHSFCISVIRKFFHVINLDPGFRIGDETENSILKLEAIEDLFEAEYEKGDDRFLGLVERFGSSKDDAPLKDLVLRLHGFIQSKPEPLAWLKEQVGDFALTASELENSPWCLALKKQISLELSGALDILREALEICRKPFGPDGYESAISSDISEVEGLLSILESSGLKACIDAFHRLQFMRLGRCSKQTDADLQETVKNLREEAKKLIRGAGEGILKYDIDTYASELNELHPYMEYLYCLVEGFDREYKVRKQEKGIIDFNDLEHYTLDILADEESAAELRQRYEYIFIDEYQDSNIVQETILSRICRGDNLFMVGDVKQSIYRFRLADPTIFLSKYDTFKPGGSPDRRIDLNKNFRSRPHILSAVNYIFGNIMSSRFGEIEYDENAALYQGGEFEPLENAQVELCLIEKAVEDLEDLDEEIEDMTDIEVEAQVAANRIKDLLGQKIYDPRLKDYRFLEYRDIVILMRAISGRASVYQEILTRNGIPVFADVNNGYFDAIEIKTIVNLLKVIDNKQQDIPLLAVLRSPIGGFSAQDLISIRTKSSKRFFHEALKEYAENRNDDLAIRLKGFMSRIEQWQRAARYMPMEDFLWKLYMESGYYYYAGAMPGGLQRQANLRLLLDRAAQFSQTSIRGLFRFLQFVDKLTESSGDMKVAKAIGENENVLRIMSIHKSKGLEFPVCIVAGLGKKFNVKDSRASFLIHKDLGLGPKYTDPETRRSFDTLAKSAIKQVAALENLSEEMRILYVALTRAKDRLILIGSVGGLDKAALKWAKKVSPYTLSHGKTYLDWICPVLMRHKDGGPLRGLLGPAGDAEEQGGLLDGRVKDDYGSSWHIRIYTRSDVSKMVGGMAKDRQQLKALLDDPPAASDGELKKLIEGRFSYSYPYRFASEIPSKLTVTEIKKINTPKSLYKTPVLVDRPKFIEGKKQFTAAERGSIMHFIMQHLDLTRVGSREAVKQQINDMIALELLTPEEAKVADVGIIVEFFRGETGKRILSAGRVWREVPFNFKKEASEVVEGLDRTGETLLIQGVIDCFFEENGHWVLVDYKTDLIETEADIARAVNNYRIQIDLYTEALEKLTGKPVGERILYLLSINRAIRL